MNSEGGVSHVGTLLKIGRSQTVARWPNPHLQQRCECYAPLRRMSESLPFYLCQPTNCSFVLVTVAGVERYKILKVIQKQPVLIAEVR